MNPDNKLSKLKEMMNLLNEGLTRAEFVSSFKEVVAFVKKVEMNLTAKIDAKLAQVRNGRDGKDGAKGDKGDKGDRGERGPIGKTFIALRGAQGLQGAPGKDGSPDTAEEIADKLNTTEGSVQQSVIEGLEETIKQLRKEIATKSGGGVRRVFQPYVDNFSSLTDGSTKTFTLSREPLKTETVLVWGTDFPVVLNPTTDFTIVGRTLTLTSAIPAPNTGATLLVRYDA